MCCFDGNCDICSQRALEALRRKLTEGAFRPEVIATATFTRTDGRTVVLTHVNVDAIGPSAETPGVIGVEFTNDSDRIVHLPFIESWEISYD